MARRYNYKFDRKKALSILDKLEHSKKEVVYDDAIRTRSLINLVFDEYEEPGLIEQVKFAFLIPTRASRFEQEYWEEVYEYFPAFRYMDIKDAFAILSSLPPFRIEMYGAEGESSSGVLIFVPVFNDMLKDYRNRLLLLRSVRKRINQAVTLANKKFGVEYVGLGATLPKLTNYGKTIKADVVTTTGHAGTTYLIVETVMDAIKRNKFDIDSLNIGFIGGGAIGLAAMQALAELLPKAKFSTFDKRPKINSANRQILKKAGKDLTIAKSNQELIENSQLIVSAITSSIDVGSLDLTGKVIVDDSQPGSFNREQVRQNGGELQWVIGKDGSGKSIATRRQGYSYGPHGLHYPSDIWGCEAEVASISYANRPDAAVKDAVTQADIAIIKQLFDDFGITIAEPQSHGQLND